MFKAPKRELGRSGRKGQLLLPLLAEEPQPHVQCREPSLPELSGPVVGSTSFVILPFCRVSIFSLQFECLATSALPLFNFALPDLLAANCSHSQSFRSCFLPAPALRQSTTLAWRSLRFAPARHLCQGQKPGGTGLRAVWSGKHTTRFCRCHVRSATCMCREQDIDHIMAQFIQVFALGQPWRKTLGLCLKCPAND